MCPLCMCRVIVLPTYLHIYLSTRRQGVRVDRQVSVRQQVQVTFPSGKYSENLWIPHDVACFLFSVLPVNSIPPWISHYPLGSTCFFFLIFHLFSIFSYYQISSFLSFFLPCLLFISLSLLSYNLPYFCLHKPIFQSSFFLFPYIYLCYFLPNLLPV